MAVLKQKGILTQAEAIGKRVTIHVEMFNPALKLYERLGFEKKGEHGVYHFMEWAPATAHSQRSADAG